MLLRWSSSTRDKEKFEFFALQRAEAGPAAVARARIQFLLQQSRTWQQQDGFQSTKERKIGSLETVAFTMNIHVG
jgi:hypothetical protein